MKTAAELRDKWRADAASLRERVKKKELYESALTAAAIRDQCADELEAWLKKADEFAEAQQIINHVPRGRDEAWTEAWLLMRQHLFGTLGLEEK